MAEVLEVLAAVAVPALLVALAWRAASRRRVNPPLLASIEPRIRPLVDALNATGLVETFTSCEGHYGHRRRLGDFTNRAQASVGFVLREGVGDEELARLFGGLFPERPLPGADGTELTLAKHHVPGLDGAGKPEVFFELSVRPLDPRASSLAKRTATDHMLAVITRGVERAVQLRRARSASPTSGAGVRPARRKPDLGAGRRARMVKEGPGVRRAPGP